MTAVKWALFFVAIVAAHPAGRWLRERPQLRIHLWTLVGLMPFLDPRNISLIFFGGVPGDTWGIEVALVDWLALSLLLAAKPTGKPLPYRFALAAYLLVVLASVLQARWTLVSFGYAWKLGRMYLLFAAVWRAGCDDQRVPAAILRGMTFGVVYEGLLAGWQHFGEGLTQARGTFVHQNTLGMVSNLVVMVPIARILAGRTPAIAKVAVGAAIASSIFTVSRGALLFFGVGSALVYAGSVYRKYTQRKAWLGFAALVLCAAMVPVAVSQIEESRSVEDRTRSLSTRGDLENAAALMLQEHPLGVGPNAYTTELLHGGYGVRAGVTWSMWTAIVHNVYWLTLAEMGPLGLAALILLFASPLVTAFRYAFRRRREPRGDVVLGLGVGLAILYAHSLFEWIWRLTEVSYLQFMVAAMVPVLASRAPVTGARRNAAVPSARPRGALAAGSTGSGRSTVLPT